MSSEDTERRFQALYERRYASVVGFLSQRFDREIAKELAQDCFQRVHKAMDGIGVGAEWAFLKTTARRAAANEYRRRHAQMRDKPEVSFEVLAQLHDGGPDTWPDPSARSPESELIEREDAARTKAKLLAAIAKLSKTLRLCLQYRLHDLKYREVAAIMGISMDAVKARLKEARRRLREELGEDGEGFGWPSEGNDDDQEE